MVPTWYPTSQNRKIWCLTFLKHYQTSLYDFQSQILKVLIFGKFQNFHLWVKIFRNRNRPVSAGKSCPTSGFRFFYVKTLLYIKCSHCGHVLATIRNSILKILIFSENPQITFFCCNFNLPHGTQKIRNFYDRKVWCLSFLTHFRTSSYDL